MAGKISPRQNAYVVIGALLVAGCSSSSDTTGQGAGSSGSGGSSGSSGSSSGHGSGSGSGPTNASDGGEDDAATDPPANDAGDEDATLSADGSSLGRGPFRDGGARDGSTRDGGMGDAGTVVTPTGDGGDTLAAARGQCVQLINMYRATLTPASPALQEDTAEEACVDGEAQADYTANTAHSAFGKCKESAQDECPGWPGPPSAINTKCLAQMWAEGPPPAGKDNHWLNMSNAKYKKVACGFYQTPSGKWWATQDFY